MRLIIFFATAIMVRQLVTSTAANQRNSTTIADNATTAEPWKPLTNIDPIHCRRKKAKDAISRYFAAFDNSFPPTNSTDNQAALEVRHRAMLRAVHAFRSHHRGHDLYPYYCGTGRIVCNAVSDSIHPATGKVSIAPAGNMLVRDHDASGDECTEHSVHFMDETLVLLEDALDRIPSVDEVVPHVGSWLGAVREVRLEAERFFQRFLEYGDSCMVTEKTREQDKRLGLVNVRLVVYVVKWEKAHAGQTVFGRVVRMPQMTLWRARAFLYAREFRAKERRFFEKYRRTC